MAEETGTTETSPESTATRGENMQPLSPEQEIRERILGGIRLAQMYGAGTGEYLPEGTVVDADTGDILVRRPEPPKADEEEKPAEEPEVESTEEKPTEEQPSEADDLLARLQRYIDRLRRG